MNLANTKTKLEDARTTLSLLKSAKNPVEFRAAFSAFINNSRAITYAMQADGSKDHAFMQWYEQRRLEMQKDELIRFVHDSRIEDFHKGIHQLDFVSQAKFANLDPATVMSRSPHLFSGNDTWEIFLTGEGLFTTVNSGTPQEQRAMLDQSLLESTKISVQNPPKSHMGRPLNSDNPTYLCELVMTYFEKLVFQAAKPCANCRPAERPGWQLSD